MLLHIYRTSLPIGPLYSVYDTYFIFLCFMNLVNIFRQVSQKMATYSAYFLPTSGYAVGKINFIFKNLVDILNLFQFRKSFEIGTDKM